MPQDYKNGSCQKYIVTLVIIAHWDINPKTVRSSKHYEILKTKKKSIESQRIKKKKHLRFRLRTFYLIQISVDFYLVFQNR